MPFEIVFAEVVESHLKCLTANARAKLFDAIERQLKHEPLVTMNTIALTSANRPLADYVAGLDEELFVLDGEARPVAALVPLSKVDAERAKLSADPAFREIIRRSREQVAAGKTVTLDDMKKRMSG